MAKLNGENVSLNIQIESLVQEREKIKLENAQSALKMITSLQSLGMEIMFKEISRYVTYAMLRALDTIFSRPMRVETINGKRYILVIVDDYSRYTWVYFLRTKDEAPEMIIKFINQIQWNMKVQVLKVQSDNRTEFKNKKLSAITISCNPVQQSRTKHINIRYHFIKEHVEQGTIKLYFVGMKYQLVDLFTEALPKERFKYLVHMIVVYLQQFWKLVKQVLNANETIHFMVDKQEITYTMDMLRATLKLPVETPEQPFIPLASFEYRQPFLKIVDYQGLVNKHQKPISITIPPPSDDRERDEIHEATILRLALHKTTKIAEEQENVVAVEKKILEEDVEKIVDGEDEEFYASEFAETILLDEEDFNNRLEPGSHKKNPKEIFDDDNEEEEKDDKKDDDNDDHDDHAFFRTQVSGSSEGNTEKMQTPTSLPPRSLRKDLSSDKTITQELTAFVSPTPATFTQDYSKPTSSKRKNLPRKKMKEMNETLRNKVPELTVSKTNEHIKEALLRMVNDAVHAFAATTTTSDLQCQLYLKIKMDFQAQVANPELWNVLKGKFEKSSTSASSCRTNAFCNSIMMNIKEMMVPLRRIKRVWESMYEDIRRSKSYALVFYGPQRNPNEPPGYLYNKDIFFLKYGNTKEKRYVLSLHKIHAVSFSEEDPKENLIRWERVYDFQLGIESYQIKINLTSPTLIFPGIKECDPFSIVDKPTTSLIYLNIENEKRVIYLGELSKFCDATLEKVLKEVKLKIFEIELSKKVPLLGSLDLMIMKSYKREIKMRLSHHKQMRRWESFVYGRSILHTMRRQ
nr:ribonuclease H [Tanacetum cinerariifolium]